MRPTQLTDYIYGCIKKIEEFEAEIDELKLLPRKNANKIRSLSNQKSSQENRLKSKLNIMCLEEERSKFKAWKDYIIQNVLCRIPAEEREQVRIELQVDPTEKDSSA